MNPSILAWTTAIYPGSEACLFLAIRIVINMHTHVCVRSTELHAILLSIWLEIQSRLLNYLYVCLEGTMRGVRKG